MNNLQGADERNAYDLIDLDKADESEKADFSPGSIGQVTPTLTQEGQPEAQPHRHPPVTIVSLGPGDPELITLKGLNKLRAADVIYCPSTAGSDGTQTSRAADILQSLAISPSVIHCFSVTMRDDRSAALADYGRVVEQIAADWASGRRVAVTAEGDAGFYSSSGYVSALLSARDIPTERIAGVPAFIACAASEGVVVAEQNEETDILTTLTSPSDLLRRVTSGRSVVLMKPSRYVSAVKVALTQAPADIVFHYFEHTGANSLAYYTSDRTDIALRLFPYFSLLIVRKA